MPIAKLHLNSVSLQRTLADTDKIIIDGGVGRGMVPFLPLDRLHKRRDEGN